mgnify:CR=1 FL=1
MPPKRVFGYFLHEQKVTPPAGASPPAQGKTSGLHAALPVAHQLLPARRQSGLPGAAHLGRPINDFFERSLFKKVALSGAKRLFRHAEAGTITGVAVDKYKNVYEKHPATGAAIMGSVIPDWDKAKELVTRAASGRC